MTSWATRLLRRKTRTYNPRPRIPFRPRLEVLEDRVTPTLTDHGGAVLASVQVQAVYLGSSWNASPISTTVFDSFLNSLVSNTPSGQAPYLAMLHNAGFAGVTGNGSALTGVQDNVNVPSTITDSQIQADLQAEIRSSAVQQPNTQTLYEVFVQPGAVVSIGNNETSVNTFLAYHSSFSANGALVRYAVVPFHGTAGNAQAPWLNQLDSMTVAASHETAEAITDPDGHTYYDRSGNEIGDVVNGSTVYLNGYAVQREGSLPASLSNFLPMTPAGATAGHSTTFAIGSGALQVNGVGVANPSGETGKVVAISTQGIDDFGQPMVDVVFSDGKAYEYHDFLPNNPTAVANPSFFPWTYLSANVKLVPAGQGYSAVAGQGVSYVLLTNGALGEYVDPNYFTYYYGFGVNPGARYGAIATGVTSIIATHTDPLGVNAVDYTVVVRGKTTTYEWRDVTATASTTITGSPSLSTKHSEIPDANGGFSTSQQALAVLLVTPAFQAGSFPTATVALSPTVFSATNRSAIPVVVQPPQFNHPDGGGSEELLPGDATNPTPSDAPTTLADVPVVGPLLLEAGGQLKAVRSMIPPALLPAQLPTHAAPPVGPKETPQSQAPAPNRLKGFAANALLALFGFGFAGLIHEDRRRRPPRRGGERPA